VLAEVERLRASLKAAIQRGGKLTEENERLRAKLAETEAYWEECQTEHHKLNVENERLRAEAKAQGTQDFTDVLYRATFAEAKIEAALEAVPLSSECAAGHVAAVTKALKGRR
jgi:predicted nuclease with TOPRIM domain